MPAPLPVIVDSRGADERRASPAPLQALQRGDAVSSWLLTGGSVNVYDGHLSLPRGLALGSPIFPSGCEGKLGVALESLQGRKDLT